MTRTKITNLDMESPGESAGLAFLTDGAGGVILSGVAGGHDPLTVVDTASLNLEITGQALSGYVIESGLDHGLLSGLTDDDHPQYALSGHLHDNRYYLESEVDNLLSLQDELSELDDTSVGGVSPGEVLTWNGTDWVPSGVAGIDTDEKVKVTSNDTTAGYLDDKLIEGDYIILTEVNDAGDEDLRITASGLAPSGHLHDSRYYLESEVDTLLAAQDELSELNDVDLTGLGQGDFLGYDGANWVPSGVQGGAGHSAVTVTDTASLNLELTGQALSGYVLEAGLDHGLLFGLADDDHSQYALLAGRDGGQTLIGGTQAGDNLILRSQDIVILDPVNNYVDIGAFWQNDKQLRFWQGSNGTASGVATIRADWDNLYLTNAGGEVVIEQGYDEDHALSIQENATPWEKVSWYFDGSSAGGTGVHILSSYNAQDINLRLRGIVGSGYLNITDESSVVQASISSIGSAVFNEQGNDADFRIESDTITNALFVQGSDGFVGLGTPVAPLYSLHIDEAADANRAILLQAGGSAGRTASLLFKTSSNDNDEYIKGALIFEDDGSTSARGTLHLATNIEDSNANVSIADSRFMVNAQGYIGIGTVSPQTLFHASGVGTFNSYLDIQEISEPATPASNFFRIYPKIDGRLYGKNDGGTEYDLTSSGGGGSSIEVFDEGSSLTTGVTSLDFVGTGVTATAVGNDVTVTVASGIGGGGTAADGSYWEPLAPPASGTVYDDEFSDSSFDTGLWTEMDFDTIQTVSEGIDGLTISQTTNPGDDITGIYQSIPAGDFTITTKPSLRSKLANYSSIGIALFEDATSSTGNIAFGVLAGDSNSIDWAVSLWNDYQNWGSTPFLIENYPDAYIRIRRNGTTYSWDFSGDGISWIEVYVNSSLGWTPTHFGLAIDNNTTGGDVAGTFQFFRYTDSDVGVISKSEGRRIAFWDKDSVAGGNGGVSDHGDLTGLADDDHVQYALLSGRIGGQVLYGGTGSGDDLTLITNDDIIIDPGGIVSISGSVGINNNAPNQPLHISTSSTLTGMEINGNRPFIFINHDDTAGFAGGIAFQQNSTSELELFYDSNADELLIWETGTGARVAFEKTGNVGIGTTTPGSLLDVRGASGVAGTLTLATNDLTIVDGDVLGQINFQAPLESDGSDAILVGASIWAEADATFTAIANNTELVFATNSSAVATEQMRLTANGYLGIGTTNPDGTLHIQTSDASAGPAHFSADDLVVEANASAGITILSPNDETNYLVFGDSTDATAGWIEYDHNVDSMTLAVNNSNQIVIASDGGVTMNNLLDASASTDINLNAGKELHTVTSSKRFKKYIKPLQIPVSKVYDLQPRSFTWRKGVETEVRDDFGLIAEEVAKIVPELVNYDEEGPYSIRTPLLGVLLLAAIQDLNDRISALEAQDK